MTDQKMQGMATRLGKSQVIPGGVRELVGKPVVINSYENFRTPRDTRERLMITYPEVPNLDKTSLGERIQRLRKLTANPDSPKQPHWAEKLADVPAEVLEQVLPKFAGHLHTPIPEEAGQDGKKMLGAVIARFVLLPAAEQNKLGEALVSACVEYEAEHQSAPKI